VSSDSVYHELRASLRSSPETWLVTGAAGFIGSHLVENLLGLDQHVVGLDNLSTGYRHNLDDVRSKVTAEQWTRFRFQEGDITRLDDCHLACVGVQRVLHQAGLGSVPRSLADPLRSHASNVDGFINMLVAARDAKVSRFVYASSSSVYGDHPVLPKVEANIGRPLSPYAATKLINEIYAGVFHRSYGLPVIGLRYFNVFGPRQDPNGAYAAVIPKWFAAAAKGEPIVINGDGETSRDFCYIANVVQANLLAATTINPKAIGFVYNVAAGRRTTLNELFAKIRARVGQVRTSATGFEAQYQSERAGDVRHSLADVSAAKTRLGYAPTHNIDQGLSEAAAWYLKNFSRELRPVR
jgi:UDP-N-acetylglucosamine 4-epimerase